MTKKKRWWVAYAVTAAIGLAMAAALLASRNFWALTEQADILGTLCDAFFVPGIIFLSLGTLIAVSHGGFFDIFAYGVHSLGVLFTPFRKPEKHERYFEYKLAKEARRQRPRPFMLHVGAAFVAIAGICLILYYQQLG